jgi:hypothetical protein
MAKKKGGGWERDHLLFMFAFLIVTPLPTFLKKTT